MGKTWLVFENGSYYSVKCSLHNPPAGHPKPVDGYLVTEHDGDFTIAARKAVHALYNHLIHRGIKTSPIIAGFDLSERTRMDSGLTGQSGGLSFVISFARKILALEFGHIAATGVIASDGKITAVKGVETKLSTAVEIVGDNGIIFLPRENEVLVTPRMKEQVSKKGIRLIMVEHIAEVLDVLLENKDIPKKKELKWVVLIIFAMLLAGWIAWIYLSELIFPVPGLTPATEMTLEPKTDAKTVSQKSEEPAPVAKADQTHETSWEKANKPLVVNDSHPGKTRPPKNPLSKSDDQGFD